MRSRIIFGLVVVCFILCPVLVGTTFSAYYHDLEKNRQPCSDCHTLHYSESGGQPAGVEQMGPFARLLIRSTTNKLCLFCHDGSDPKAPDVLASVTMYDGSGDEHSGAGFFGNSGGADNPNGHDLGLNKASVPFGSMTNVTLTCASCHDPHGTRNYRNIVTAPAGETGTGVEMGRDVFRDSPPGDPPSTTGSVAAYRRSNESYKARTSSWCAECHDALKANVNVPGQRVHHFSDVSLDGIGYPTDPAHWVSGTGSGFGVATGDAMEGIPRLRFQVPTATDNASAKQVAANNQVICGSCHVAHGGNYRYGLVWPNKDSGDPVDRLSGCNQCHNF